jgi:two-component system, NtrC family, sensor histidine kinase HydH
VVHRTDDLSREELLRLLDATRAMARVTVEPRFDETMAGVLKIALCATKSDRAALYMFDPGSTEDLILVARHPPPEGDTVRRVRLVGSPMEEPLTTGVPRAYEAPELGEGAEPHRSEGIRHIAIVPVDVRGKPGASFNVARMLDAPYDARELRFAQVLGELLVVHADNARLYAEAHERLDETRILVEVARAVSASPELDARLDASATILAHMLDASNAFILLLEEEGTVLHGVTASNPADREEFRAVRIHCSEPSIAARAVATKQPIVVEDATSSSEVQHSLVSRYGEKSLVALPLMLRDEAIGVVVFDDTRRVRTWAAAEIQRAELIVQTVAVGVANARLYDEVRRRSLELERAQVELLSRERLAALGQLAAVMAHEVRNPLGVLFNSIGTLAKLVPSEGDSAQLLEIMREEATRLERLVRELLDFAKPLAPSLESEALHPLLLGAVDAATRELGPTTVPPIDIVVTADLPNAWLDASMMRRAVVNLVVNAVHAAGQTGRVEVRAAQVVRGQRRLVHLTVTDSGPGIPPGVIPRVFEPFFTTKATGTGLGLAVVKSIVESHGGEITLESTTGRGTVVSIFLPLAPESAEGHGQKRRRSAW